MNETHNRTNDSVGFAIHKRPQHVLFLIGRIGMLNGHFTLRFINERILAGLCEKTSQVNMEIYSIPPGYALKSMFKTFLQHHLLAALF